MTNPFHAILDFITPYIKPVFRVIKPLVLILLAFPQNDTDTSILEEREVSIEFILEAFKESSIEKEELDIEKEELDIKQEELDIKQEEQNSGTKRAWYRTKTKRSKKIGLEQEQQLGIDLEQEQQLGIGLEQEQQLGIGLEQAKEKLQEVFEKITKSYGLSLEDVEPDIEKKELSIQEALTILEEKHDTIQTILDKLEKNRKKE